MLVSTLGSADGTELHYYDGSFDGSNDGKTVGVLLGDSNDGKPMGSLLGVSVG